MSKKKPSKHKRSLMPRQVSYFAPLLSRAEKEIVKHLSQHDRVVYLHCMRLGIALAEYKAKYCQ